MRKIYNLLIIVCSTSVLSLVSGNALSIESKEFKITTVESKKATVSSVVLLKTSDGYVIKGKVRSKIKNRIIPIPGHVDISILDSKGKTINISPASIYRITRKSRVARFKQKLKLAPSSGNTIRVAHHNAPLGINATDLEHK